MHACRQILQALPPGARGAPCQSSHGLICMQGAAMGSHACRGHRSTSVHTHFRESHPSWGCIHEQNVRNTHVAEVAAQCVVHPPQNTCTYGWVVAGTCMENVCIGDATSVGSSLWVWYSKRSISFCSPNLCSRHSATYMCKCPYYLEPR